MKKWMLAVVVAVGLMCVPSKAAAQCGSYEEVRTAFADVLFAGEEGEAQALVDAWTQLNLCFPDAYYYASYDYSIWQQGQSPTNQEIASHVYLFLKQLW